MFQKQSISHQPINQAETGSTDSFLLASFLVDRFCNERLGTLVKMPWYELTGVHGYVWFIVVDCVYVQTSRIHDHVDLQLPLVVLQCC